MNQFSQQLKSHVATGQTKLALAALLAFLKDHDNENHNHCLLLHANLTTAERDFALGVISRRDAEMSLAKVKMGLLQLLDEAAKMPFDEAEALQKLAQTEAVFREPEFQIKPRRERAVWIALCGFAFLALLGWIFWPSKNPGEFSDPKIRAIAPVDTASLLAGLEKDADVYYKQGNFSKSLAAVNRAIELRPDRADFYNKRASIYLHLGNLPQAAADAKRAVVLDPENCWVYATLAQIATQQHDSEGFYQNIELSMKKHCKIWLYIQQPGIAEHADEKRFRDLLAAYQH